MIKYKMINKKDRIHKGNSRTALLLIIFLCALVAFAAFVMAVDYVYIKMDGTQISTGQTINLKTGTEYLFEASGSANVDDVRIYIKGQNVMDTGKNAAIRFKPEKDGNYELDVIGSSKEIQVTSAKIYLQATSGAVVSNTNTNNNNVAGLDNSTIETKPPYDSCGAANITDAFIKDCRDIICKKSSKMYKTKFASQFKLAFIDTDTVNVKSYNGDMTANDVLIVYNIYSRKTFIFYGANVNRVLVRSFWAPVQQHFYALPCESFNRVYDNMQITDVKVKK